MSYWLKETRKRLDVAITQELPARDALLDSFFRWALRELDADEYAEIQREPPARGLKYLRFTFFARKMMASARDLGLDAGPKKRILDLGCGSGHFLLICRFLGHHGVGLDMPLCESHLPNRLCRFFGVEKIDHRIEPYEALPRSIGRFDLITATLIKFDRTSDSDNERWGVQEWEFFINSITHDYLTPDGKLYLYLNSRSYQKPDVWRYLRSRGNPMGYRRGVLISNG